MVDDKFNLQPLKEQGFAGDEEEAVVAAFETAFESLSKTTSEVALDEAAKTIALKLQNLVSPELPAERKEYLFEIIWEGLIGVAKHVPYRHRGQLLITKALQELDRVETGTKFPYLGRCLRDNWIDPTFETVKGEEETYSHSEWLNLNSFAARIFGVGLAGWENFPIWQLRHGLEQKEDPSLDRTATDCKVAVASEWIIQAAPDLL